MKLHGERLIHSQHPHFLWTTCVNPSFLSWNRLAPQPRLLPRIPAETFRTLCAYGSVLLHLQHQTGRSSILPGLPGEPTGVEVVLVVVDDVERLGQFVVDPEPRGCLSCEPVSDEPHYLTGEKPLPEFFT